MLKRQTNQKPRIHLMIIYFIVVCCAFMVLLFEEVIKNGPLLLFIGSTTLVLSLLGFKL